MQLSDIRSAVFGYKKNDVYRYISEISDEFSARLRVIEEASEKRLALLENENKALREKIAELSKENESYKAPKATADEWIDEAKKLAERMKAEAEKEAAAIMASAAVCKDKNTEGASARDVSLSLFRPEGSTVSYEKTT